MCQVSAIFQVFFVSFCIGRISYQQLKGLSARKVHLCEVAKCIDKDRLKARLRCMI